MPCGTAGGRTLFRLLAVPFGYAKPTWGDVVAAARDDAFNGNWAWEVPRSGGCDRKHLYEDGGRYAMIIDYEASGLPKTERGAPWFDRSMDIMSSKAWDAREGRPGRFYAAVPSALKPRAVMSAVRERHPEFTFTQVHPKPRGRAKK